MPVTALPEASMSIPELSITTWPFGSQSNRKIAAGSAAMVRCTSIRSLAISASFHRERFTASPDSPGHFSARASGTRHRQLHLDRLGLPRRDPLRLLHALD